MVLLSVLSRLVSPVFKNVYTVGKKVIWELHISQASCRLCTYFFFLSEMWLLISSLVQFLSSCIDVLGVGLFSTSLLIHFAFKGVRMTAPSSLHA